LLHELVRRVRRAIRPEKIVLFGSRARGEARPGSDFDLLVVQRSTRPRYERARPVYAAIADLPAEVEVVVYTPQEIEEWRQVPRAFVTTALRQGKVLYEEES
ncbi:MAG TPA: nucleotidyltransferase domain-containing protein, partial [Phycisphaerae bacterium]|nr:nucleotidyltransferase domain-containing protein [Phycisphaerae bacterium]